MSFNACLTSKKQAFRYSERSFVDYPVLSKNLFSATDSELQANFKLATCAFKSKCLNISLNSFFPSSNNYFSSFFMWVTTHECLWVETVKVCAAFPICNIILPFSMRTSFLPCPVLESGGWWVYKAIKWAFHLKHELLILNGYRK